MPKKIFVSHSSKDKPKVRRLVSDLRNQNFEVWFDEHEIKIGDSIPRKIQEGLNESDFIVIWLTKYSIISGWVEKEWRSRISEEITKNKTIILPLLAEKDVEIPLFLKEKKYADFTDYERGIRQLIIDISDGLHRTNRSVSEYTLDLLDDLSKEVIPLPIHQPIRIIQTLQKLPRSGKLIRLETYEPKVPIRSIYDHILSVAHTADILLNEIDHNIHDQEAIELARCIAYHDICEIFLGDIPAYTNLTDRKRSRARIHAESRLSQLRPLEAERITNDFIAMFLDKRERTCFNTVNEILKDRENPISKFFWLIDKIDPIIATWRYLHQFNGRLDSNAEVFLRRMKDFFDNPRVKEVGRSYGNESVYQLILTLQDRSKARDYYLGKTPTKAIFSFPEKVFTSLIEGKKMEFILPKNKKTKESVN